MPPARRDPVVNKAFVRDPETPKDMRCPQCTAIGLSIGRSTLEKHLSSENVQQLADTNACFCPNPRCPVGYFDGFNQTVAVDQLDRCVYPKDPEAPICSCFSLSAKDVIHDACCGNPAGVRMLIAKSRSREPICRVSSPDGRCCIGQVQQLYLKHSDRDQPLHSESP